MSFEQGDDVRDFYLLKWFSNYRIDPHYDGDDLSKRYIRSVVLDNPEIGLIDTSSLWFYGIVDYETDKLLSITHGPYSISDEESHGGIVHLNDIIPATDATPECKVICCCNPLSKTSDFIIESRNVLL